MSTEWRFVEDVLPPTDEDVMVTDGEEVSMARRMDDGKWTFVHPDDQLIFGDIFAWFRIPNLPNDRDYADWRIKRYGHP